MRSTRSLLMNGPLPCLIPSEPSSSPALSPICDQDPHPSPNLPSRGTKPLLVFRKLAPRGREAAQAPGGYSLTARSVISRPLSTIAKASSISPSVMHRGGLAKNVFQRTNV